MGLVYLVLWSEVKVPFLPFVSGPTQVSDCIDFVIILNHKRQE